jgi:hypothetical protein
MKPFGGFDREAEPGCAKSDSVEEMSPNTLSLFSSRLEMVDAAQSRLVAAPILRDAVESLVLAVPAVALELPVILLLPMVA